MSQNSAFPTLSNSYNFVRNFKNVNIKISPKICPTFVSCFYTFVFMTKYYVFTYVCCLLRYQEMVSHPLWAFQGHTRLKTDTVQELCSHKENCNILDQTCFGKLIFIYLLAHHFYLVSSTFLFCMFTFFMLLAQLFVLLQLTFFASSPFLLAHLFVLFPQVAFSINNTSSDQDTLR